MQINIKQLSHPLIIAALSALSLVGCSGSPSLGQVKPAPSDYVLTISIDASSNQETLEAKYGSKAVIWKPEDGFAIFEIKEAAIGQSSQISLQSSNLEPNQSRYSAGDKMVAEGLSMWSGGLSLWSGGLSLWSGGLSMWSGGLSLWSGGNYQLIPENSLVWKKISLDAAHTLATVGGEGIKVAILDSGIDLTHPAFVGALVPNNQMWDFVADDASPQEEGIWGQGAYGHGTNVASIVLQVAPRVTLMPLRVLNADGFGDATDVASAIVWAVDRGAKIINLSLGGDYSEAVERAIAYATLKGAAIVTATGNEGRNSLNYPASYAASAWNAGVRSSVTSVDSKDIKSSFANYSDSVEIAAPGEAIYGPAPENRLAAWSGTSMSTAVVSGALALAKAQYPQKSLAQLFRGLYKNSKDISNLSANRPYKNSIGEGRVDLQAFISDCGSSSPKECK